MESTLTAFRPLQPASTTGQVASRQHYRSPVEAPKAKRRPALGACVACRERKSKCDGNRPVCECCEQRETDCVYELGENERPSDARKRRIEQLQRELVDLRNLFSCLRSCPEDEALEILHRIRTSPSDSLHPGCLSGVPRPPAQAYPYYAHADALLTTPKAGPWPCTASSSSRSAGELDRCFSPAAALPTEHTVRHYTSVPSAKNVPIRPHNHESMLPRTSIGFILQASSTSAEDTPRMYSRFFVPSPAARAVEHMDGSAGIQSRGL